MQCQIGETVSVSARMVRLFRWHWHILRLKEALTKVQGLVFICFFYMCSEFVLKQFTIFGNSKRKG